MVQVNEGWLPSKGKTGVVDVKVENGDIITWTTREMIGMSRSNNDYGHLILWLHVWRQLLQNVSELCFHPSLTEHVQGFLDGCGKEIGRNPVQFVSPTPKIKILCGHVPGYAIGVQLNITWIVRFAKTLVTGVELKAGLTF